MSIPEGTSWRRLDSPANEAEIEAVETVLGVRFPSSLRELLPKCHGASSSQELTFLIDYPKVGPTTAALGRFLSLSPTSIYFVLKAVETLREQGSLPIGVVPIAVEGGGDFIALDFRSDPLAPRVVYLAMEAAQEDHEEAHIVPVAESFETFLAMLAPDEAQHA